MERGLERRNETDEDGETPCGPGAADAGVRSMPEFAQGEEASKPGRRGTAEKP